MPATKEVLALTTATELPRSAGSTGMVIANRGPNTIWVATGPAAGCVAEKCIPIATNAQFTLWPVAAEVPVFALSETAAQIAGNATAVVELFG